MVQKHRINTTLNGDKKVTVELKQDYDLLEILSLKFTQQDAYTSLCADYGVVCGRVTANNGLGIPNARVSILIPISDQDEQDPVISTLYPFKLSSDKNDDGYRYNLLPARQQHAGHTPTGTFPDQNDILSREEQLEVFEKYYKFTAKTNYAGDYMIWGIPLGEQQLHIDVDLSDMGCFSLRPYDFIRQGEDANKFDRFFKFRSDTDLDGLPQIVAFDKTIDVSPFWGNMDLCQIGITRADFDLSNLGIKVDPVSLMLVSTVTDADSDAVKRSGVIRRKSGYKCNLQTSDGKIQGVRFTGRKVIGSDGTTIYPELEYFDPGVIDDDGTAMAVIPMNLDYVYTNEFGEQETTNDPNKGVATSTVARLKLELDNSSGEGSSRGTASATYLVPNIREFNKYTSGNASEYSEAIISSYVFSDVFEDYLSVPVPTGVTLEPLTSAERLHKKELILGTNNNDIPEDYFYKFIYGKVYTPTSFQGSHYEVSATENLFGLSRRDAFLGIKEIRPNSEDDCAGTANYVPTNFAFRNRTKFGLLVSQVLLFLQFIFAIILNFVFELLGRFFMTVGKALYAIYFGWPFNWRPFAKIGEQFQDIAHRLQVNGTQTLSLTTYPDCEECSTDDEYATLGSSLSSTYCSVGEITFKVIGIGAGNARVYVLPYSFNTSTNPDSSTVVSGGRARDYDPTDPFMSGNTFTITGSTNSATRTILNSLHTYTITPIAGDPNNARFLAEAVSKVDDTILPYSPANGDTLTKSVSLSDFTVSFSTNTAAGDITKFSTMTIDQGSLDSWATGEGNYGLTYVTNLVNVVGEYTSRTINGLILNHGSWAELSGFNYEGYSGGDNGAGNYADRGTYVTFRIYDRSKPKTDPNSSAAVYTIEEGCAKYDKAYDESISQGYLWSTGTTYGDRYIPINTQSYPYAPASYPAGYVESITKPGPTYTIMADIIGTSGSGRLPRLRIWSKLGNTYYDRKTKSGYSEIRDGVFTVIPVVEGSSKNASMIQEWYRRKRIGLFFCGGVVNYSFIDNWLHGLLYFFKFDYRIRWDDKSIRDLNQRGSKYPRELVFFNVLDGKFYYRSTPYNPTSKTFIGQSYSGYKELLHPTTFYDVGVRDEFFDEICFDPAVDPTCSVIRDLTATTYQDPGNVIEHVINYRMDVSAARTDIGDFFTNSGYTFGKVMDGDVLQLISINCEAGIEAFDLDTPHYFMFNGEFLDPEDTTFMTYFKNGSSWGPTPIDFKLDTNGSFVRYCLNNRLGDFTQKVPYFLWDKKATGFGLDDDQLWDRTAIGAQKLQRMVSVSGVTNTTTNYLMADGEEEYLIKPMTKTHNTFSFVGNYPDSLERFEAIRLTAPTSATEFVEGDLWLHVLTGTQKDPLTGNIYVVVNGAWSSPIPYVKDNNETFIYQTALNYSGNKQVLSTPFQFYFGLRPGSTAYDKFIKYYGPKGAFPSTE
jgi:hypothetical protein